MTHVVGLAGGNLLNLIEPFVARQPLPRASARWSRTARGSGLGLLLQDNRSGGYSAGVRDISDAKAHRV